LLTKDEVTAGQFADGLFFVVPSGDKTRNGINAGHFVPLEGKRNNVCHSLLISAVLIISEEV
jgi:hypothetical protein